MEEVSIIEEDFSHILQDDSDQFLADQLKAESVDSALGGSTISGFGEPHAHSTPNKLTEREQELARIIDEIDNEMDDELADDYGSTPSVRFDTLSTPTQILAHTNSDSARIQLLMEQLRRCQTQLREAKYRCDVLEVDRDSQERKMQEKLEARIDSIMSNTAKAEMALKGKLAEQQAENKALFDQFHHIKDELNEKTKANVALKWKHTENTRRLLSELDDTKLMLKKSEAELQQELYQSKEAADHIAKLNIQIQTLLAEKDIAPELSRKTNSLEEQVQYLTSSLEDSRREHSFKLAAVEQKFLTENNKLKVKEKDYQRKYKREQERNRSHSQNMRALKAELRQVKEDLQMGASMDRAKSPLVAGDWSKFKPDSKRSKKAIQDILQAVESEGGPDSNNPHATDATYFQTIIYYLWVKRDHNVQVLKAAREKLKTFGNCPPNFMDLVKERDNLKERILELEERLTDWMAENETLQSSTDNATTQLVKTKHELDVKVKHLQDTVSALHLDNNLLRAELDRSPTPQFSAQVNDLTADLKLKLNVADAELKQEKLVTEELGTQLKHTKVHCDQLNKALVDKENEHKAAMKKLRDANAKVIELDKKKAVLDSQVERLKQERNTAKDGSQKLERKLRDVTSDLNQVKQKQDKTNRARDALKAQIDALKAEVIDVKGQNVSLMQDNETLEDRLQDAQEELEKARLQLEIQEQEMVSQTTEEKVEAAVLSETLKSEQDRAEELDLDNITKKAQISQLHAKLDEQKNKYQQRVKVEREKVKGLQDALKEKEMAVGDLRKKLLKEIADKNAKMMDLKNKIAAQESETDKIVQLKEKLDEQEKEYSDKECENEKRCKQLEQGLNDKESAISDLEMQVADIIDEKTGVISDLENKISKLEKKSMAENQKDVYQLKNLEEHKKALMTELDETKKTCRNLQQDILGKSHDIDRLVEKMENDAKEKNNKIAQLERDMKQEENLNRNQHKTITDLNNKLLDLADKQESLAMKLDEEMAKCQILRRSVSMKDESIAQLEQKLSEKMDLDNASRVALLEKQLNEQEINFKIEAEEETEKFKTLEESLNKKDEIIEKLKAQIKSKMEEETDDLNKRHEEVTRMEKLIKLEENMSVLIEEKDRMQEKIQILSKDKTILQADKQLLELELADRTKKLQKIMRDSITPSCSSRSSSRRSSIDSRVGRADSNVGRADYRVGRTDSNVGRADYRVGRADSNVGRSDYSVGRADSNVGRADYRVGRTDSNVGRADYRVGRTDSNAGVGKDKTKKSKIPVRDGKDGIQKENGHNLNPNGQTRNKNKQKERHSETSKKLPTQSKLGVSNETLQDGNHGNSHKYGIHGNSHKYGNKSKENNSQSPNESTVSEALLKTDHSNNGDMESGKTNEDSQNENQYSTNNQDNDINTNSLISDADTERLQLIDNFISTLLDLHVTDSNDFDNLRCEIAELQQKASGGSTQANSGNNQASSGNNQSSNGSNRASSGNNQASSGNDQARSGNNQTSIDNNQASNSNYQASSGSNQASSGNNHANSGSNQPVLLHQSVVAKLGALYQVMKAKKKLDDKTKPNNDNRGDLQPNKETKHKADGQTTRILETEEPISKEEVTLLQSMPALMLEAINSLDDDTISNAKVHSEDPLNIRTATARDETTIRGTAPNINPSDKVHNEDSLNIRTATTRDETTIRSTVTSIKPSGKVHNGDSLNIRTATTRDETTIRGTAPNINPSGKVHNEDPLNIRTATYRDETINSTASNINPSGKVQREDPLNIRTATDRDETVNGDSLGKADSGTTTNARTNEASNITDTVSTKNTAPDESCDSNYFETTARNNNMTQELAHTEPKDNRSGQKLPHNSKTKPAQYSNLKNKKSAESPLLTLDLSNYDTNESYDICGEINKPKSGSTLLTPEGKYFTSGPSKGGTNSRNPSRFGSKSRTDAADSFTEDGDDDVFCDTGVQNEAELERLAIMHALVSQMRRGRENTGEATQDWGGDTIDRSATLGWEGDTIDRSATQGWGGDTIDRSADLRYGDVPMSEDNDAKNTVPSNRNNTAHQNNGVEEAEAEHQSSISDTKSSDDEASLDTLMERLGKAFDINIDITPRETKSNDSKPDEDLFLNARGHDQKDTESTNPFKVKAWMSEVKDTISKNQQKPETGKLHDEAILLPMTDGNHENQKGDDDIDDEASLYKLVDRLGRAFDINVDNLPRETNASGHEFLDVSNDENLEISLKDIAKKLHEEQNQPVSLQPEEECTSCNKNSSVDEASLDKLMEKLGKAFNINVDIASRKTKSTDCNMDEDLFSNAKCHDQKDTESTNPFKVKAWMSKVKDTISKNQQKPKTVKLHDEAILLPMTDGNNENQKRDDDVDYEASLDKLMEKLGKAFNINVGNAPRETNASGHECLDVSNDENLEASLKDIAKKLHEGQNHPVSIMPEKEVMLHYQSGRSDEDSDNVLQKLPSGESQLQERVKCTSHNPNSIGERHSTDGSACDSARKTNIHSKTDELDRKIDNKMTENETKDTNDTSKFNNSAAQHHVKQGLKVHKRNDCNDTSSSADAIKHTKPKLPSTQISSVDSVVNSQPKMMSSWEGKTQMSDDDIRISSRKGSQSGFESDLSCDTQAKHMGLQEFLSQRLSRGRSKSKIPRSGRSQSLNSKHCRSDSSEVESGQQTDRDKAKNKQDQPKYTKRRSRSSENDTKTIHSSPRKCREQSKTKQRFSNPSESKLNKPDETRKRKHRNLPNPRSRLSGSSDNESSISSNNRNPTEANIDKTPPQRSHRRRKLPSLEGSKIPVSKGIHKESLDNPKSICNKDVSDKNQPSSAEEIQNEQIMNFKTSNKDFSIPHQDLLTLQDTPGQIIDLLQSDPSGSQKSHSPGLKNQNIQEHVENQPLVEPKDLSVLDDTDQKSLQLSQNDGPNDSQNEKCGPQLEENNTDSQNPSANNKCHPRHGNVGQHYPEQSNKLPSKSGKRITDDIHAKEVDSVPRPHLHKISSTDTDHGSGPHLRNRSSTDTDHGSGPHLCNRSSTDTDLGQFAASISQFVDMPDEDVEEFDNDLSKDVKEFDNDLNKDAFGMADDEDSDTEPVVFKRINNFDQTTPPSKKKPTKGPIGEDAETQTDFVVFPQLTISACQTEDIVILDRTSTKTSQSQTDFPNTISATSQTDVILTEDNPLQSIHLNQATSSCQTEIDVEKENLSGILTSCVECQTDISTDFKSMKPKSEHDLQDSIGSQTEICKMLSVDCQTNNDLPSVLSTGCQADSPSVLSTSCQTEKDSPSVLSTGCQTEKDSSLVLSMGCQTNKDSVLSRGCQTDKHSPIILSMGCQTEKDSPPVLSTGCQTVPDKDSPSVSSVYCQTIPENHQISSTTAAECQTDLQDNGTETTLMDMVEELQNLRDKQKMKTKAFKEAARTYKGEMRCMAEQMKNDKAELDALQDKTSAQEAQLHQLTHKNHQLEVDLGLTRDYLDNKKAECQDLQQAVYDGALKENDLTSTLKEIQDQMQIEKQVQDKLNEKCVELESELLDTKSQLVRSPQPTPQPPESISSIDDVDQSPQLSPVKTAKQVQNETDDRKKLSELEAQNEMDRITIDTLKEENQHLREIIEKLKAKAYSKWKENPDSQFKDIYQALAKAQVQALAMKLAASPNDMGNTMMSFRDTLTSPRPGSGMSGLGTTLGSEFGYT